MKRVIFDWDNIFDRFLEQLDVETKVILLRRIKAIENVGIMDASQRQWVKLLNKREKLFEIRARSKQFFPRAIYFQVKGNLYFITHGFNKKSNKTPNQEIERGIKRKRLFLWKKEGEKDE